MQGRSQEKVLPLKRIVQKEPIRLSQKPGGQEATVKEKLGSQMTGKVGGNKANLMICGVKLPQTFG